MKLEKVINKPELLKQVKKLYQEAFPKYERAPFWLLKKRAKQEKADMYAIYEENQFIGLVYAVSHLDIVFVFYLAIEESQRGKGYGTKVLDALKEQYIGNRILLNIEEVNGKASNFAQRMKRKKFYLKNGFEEAGHKVKEGNEIYEMLSYGGIVTSLEYQELMEIYFGKFLYHQFYLRIAEFL